MLQTAKTETQNNQPNIVMVMPSRRRRSDTGAIRFEQVDVTPALAEQWLARNDGNRNVRGNVVRRYVRDMEAGRWLLSPQPIVIASDGRLLDGQHRLHAVVESGKTVPMYVARGADKTVMAVIDNGEARSLSDALHFEWGTRPPNLMTGTAIAMLRGVSPTRPQLTRQEWAYFATKHRDALTYAFNKIDATNRRGVRRAPVAGVIARAYYHVDHDKLDEFCEVLRTGVASKAGHRSVIRLRDYLLTNTAHGHGANAEAVVVYRKTLRTLAAFLKGEKLEKLYEATEDCWDIPGVR